MTIRCPMCGANLNIGVAQPGVRVKLQCPRCNRSVSLKIADAEPAAPAPAPPAPGPPDEMTFAVPDEPDSLDHGDLERRPLPVVLADRWKEHATGVLVIETGGGEQRFHMRQGDVVSFTSTRQDSRALPLLRDARKISDEAYHAWSDRGLPDDELVEKMTGEGLLDASKLSAAYSRGCERLIHELAGAVGTFRFEAGPSGPRRLKIVLESVLLDALRRSVPEGQVKAALPDLARKLCFVPAAMSFFQTLSLTDDEQRLLTMVDGQRTIGDVIGAEEGGTWQAMRSIYALLAFGVLEPGDSTPGWVAPPSLAKLPSRPADAAPPGGRSEAMAHSASTPQRRPIPAPPRSLAPAPAAPPTPAQPTPAPAPPVRESPTAPVSDGFDFVLEAEERVRKDEDGPADDSSFVAETLAVEELVDEGREEPPPAATRPEFVYEVPSKEGAPPPGGDDQEDDEIASPWMGLPPNPDIATLRLELESLTQGIEEKDYYQILHVSPHASHKAIKRAYFGFARRYHPDKFYSFADEPFKRYVDQIYTKVTVAFETLKDGERRAAYESAERRPPQEKEDTQSGLIQAEIKYQDAHGAYLRKEYEEAIESVGWAIQLNGEKPKYHALLGRCLAQVEPPKRDYHGAIAAFERALVIEPQHAMYKVQIGQVYRLTGQNERARKAFREALAIDRDCHEASRELRLIDMRTSGKEEAPRKAAPAKPNRAATKDKDAKKKGGLFGKLLGRG